MSILHPVRVLVLQYIWATDQITKNNDYENYRGKDHDNTGSRRPFP